MLSLQALPPERYLLQHALPDALIFFPLRPIQGEAGEVPAW